VVVKREDRLDAAYRELAGLDPVFSRVLRSYGQPDPFEWFDGGRTATSLFAAMALHIISQRISASAAFTVFDRIAAAGGGIPSAGVVLALGQDRLRDLGMAGDKAACLIELSRRQVSGVIDVERLGALDDGQVIAALTDVPGIGLWSAQAFLMRQLHRPDVLPAGDTGIRRAMSSQWRLASLPTPRQVRERAAGWSPYRSYASALLWRSLRPAGEPSDPKARALASKSKPATSG
jgi:3-methyladenine DNA glycosylase/8-oxoguanine DNA glycosylase